MSSKVLWLDVDGVLLDWVRPFLKYIGSPIDYDELDQYDLSFLFENGTEDMIKTINEFNATELYHSLKPLVGKDELQKLKDVGYELRVITQVDGKLQRVYRLDNLCRVFGNTMFSQILCTSRGTSKAEKLRELYPYDTITVVEDNPGFFKDAEKVGGFKGIAIQHGYNQKKLKALSGFPIYTDMQEVVRDLCR